MKQTWKSCSVLLVILILATTGAQAAPDRAPWQDFPQIYDAYEERETSGAVWFFAKEVAQLPSLYDAYTYPALAIRYDVHDDRFGIYAITDELVPNEVREYWQEKAKRQVISIPHFPYELRWPDVIEAPADSGFYEVKDTALLYHTWNSLEIFSPPPITKDELCRYGKIVEMQYGSGGDQTDCGWWDESMTQGSDTLESNTRLGPFVQIDQKIYFGLLGGFDEGIGTFGGMAIFDLTTRKWEVLRPPLLLGSKVTSIAQNQPDELWMGTLTEGEGEESPISGLVIYNLASQEWKSYTTKNSPITGDLVRLVTLADFQLWVATEHGISRVDEKTNTWINYKWRKATTAGATVELERVGAGRDSAVPQLR